MWWEAVRVLGKCVRPIETVLSGLTSGKRPLPGHTLFHFQASPFAFKVRRELIRQRIQIPMKDILEDSAAQAELVASGGRDQVPCLKIEHSGVPARWLYESDEIVKYLRERNPNGQSA